jgi:hypothetical protein
LAHRSNSDHALILLERCAVVVLGLYLVGVGLNAIVTTGGWTYLNSMRSPVAAPVAIGIGIVLIAGGFAPAPWR